MRLVEIPDRSAVEFALAELLVAVAALPVGYAVAVVPLAEVG